jgi:hypothetical protein
MKRTVLFGEVWAAQGSSTSEAAFSGEVLVVCLWLLTKSCPKSNATVRPSKHESIFATFFDSIWQFHLPLSNDFGIAT